MRPLKKRPEIVIYMELLGLLREGPRGPTRLAQALGLSYDRFARLASILEERKFIVNEAAESYTQYRITPEGVQLHQDWTSVKDRLGY